MTSTSSSRNRKPLEPRRQVGRRRVAELIEAASAVIQERGFDAATMAEIAARAEARIGSLYRFFPNKEAVAEALVDRYTEVLQAEYDAIAERAAGAPPEVVADTLIDLFIKLKAKTRAVAALLEGRTDWTEVRLRFRRHALAGVKAALTACAPGLADQEAEDVAVVVFNNMKTMAQMDRHEAPTSPGAPAELRQMNRLYLAAKLGTRRSPKPKSKRPTPS
jgi:AcrR family transcriptional regulator